MSVDQQNGDSGARRTETLGRAEFHGQGIQHTGPGSFNVRGNVYIGAASHGDDRDDKLLRALRTTDPRDDKARIVRQKGGLLVDSYRWILDHDDFQQWRDGEETRLLWIKGDPGKGKTMLLCGIIDELERTVGDYVTYFFCQATDVRLNNAIAVLKGLVYLLLFRQPTLAARVRDRYGHVDEKLLREVNGWDTLCSMLLSLLQEPGVQTPYLIVDGLDECQTGLDDLLWLIVRLSSSRARILVSSRNWPSIDDALSAATLKVPLCLELNTQAISAAVDIYIGYKVEQLKRSKKYDEETRKTVQQYLASNADGTFLWVALVCQELSDPKVRKWHTLAMLNDFLTEFPSGLDALYVRMAEQIFGSRDAELCRQVLAVASVVFRPVALTEILSLVESPGDFPDEANSLREIIELCGSFLTLREGVIHFVHQSAKDFLMKKVLDKILPQGLDIEHNMIATLSVQAMSRTLKRNVYKLPSPGFSIDMVKVPDPDPLGPVRYACVYWADHLRNGMSKTNKHDLQDGGFIHSFLVRHFLYWLEALSLLRNIEAGIVATEQVLSMVRVSLQDEQDSRESDLAKLAQDAWRFIRYYKTGIEVAPLQVYVSALVFSPALSMVRKLFRKEEPEWMLMMPLMEEDWSACLQTLDGHSEGVTSVVFSPDGKQLASGSYDGTVRMWDSATGENLRTLEGGDGYRVYSVAFSPDCRQVASASDDGLKMWDAATGRCLWTLDGSGSRSVAFSPDGRQMVSGSNDGVYMWNAVTGEFLTTLTGHSDYHNDIKVQSVAFSPDSTQVASASDNGLQIWDAATGRCLWTHVGGSRTRSVAFSPNSKQVAWSSYGSVLVWDLATGENLRTLGGGDELVYSVAFSPDGRQLASGSGGGMARVWDAATGRRLRVLHGHDKSVVRSVEFSPDGRQLASGSEDSRVWLWNIATRHQMTLEGHSGPVQSVTLSPNGRQVASGSSDGTVRVWDTTTGMCLMTLKYDGEDYWRYISVAFSPNNKLIASKSDNRRRVSDSGNIVRIWDTVTGRCLWTLRDYNVVSVAFSLDSRRVVMGSEDGMVRVRNVATGECEKTWTHGGHDSCVYSVGFSPNGRQVVSGSDDGTVRVWDAVTGECLKCIRTLKGYPHGIRSVAFSADGRRVASGLEGGTARVWGAATGHPRVDEDDSCSVYSCSVYSCEGYSCEGHRILWDPARLRIDFGTYDPRENNFSRMNIPQDTLPGMRISLDKTWILNDGEPALWLPPEYRPSCIASSDKVLALGYRSGRVLLFRFS
ncbi:hypothetical protein TrVFT333_004678 [Trichoderma virens FT-333]|nr:hypothetical protein TrVFT333_004678 [Trichoderma virens FT-333]